MCKVRSWGWGLEVRCSCRSNLDAMPDQQLHRRLSPALLPCLPAQAERFLPTHMHTCGCWG